ncbi:uncharacterized protein LOC131997010 [Stomoxys calcitrans]|uniref:uncharacterized protein LOC131997010 n=1 Tax=Stomoxys calcitrans TaxID=35570 RepID=UPI0027E279D3|nr:uncharacterized protein LOC131997010 [Stomoxys calcitrans]
MQASYIESTCKTPRLSNYESPQRLVMLIDKRFEKQNELIQTLIKESETRLLHELDKRISDFQSEITSLKERIVNMETVADKINVIEKDIFELKSQKMVYPQNSELENEIKILKAQLAKQENFHVASELRINGIPSYNGENLNILFSNICNCFNIPTPTVKSIYRLKNKIRQNNDATIIVDLMSSYDKNYILKSMAFFKRTNKTPLLLNHIGFDSNYVVHINENLTTILKYVNNYSKILLYDQLCAPGFSKHDLLFFIYDVHVNTTPTSYTYRDFKNIDLNLVNSCLDKINWNFIYALSSVDDQLTFLQNNLLFLYNYCVPVKTKVVNHNQQPWFNNNIKILIKQRDLAYQRWQRFKTSYLHDIFKHARRAVVRSINAAKYEYYSRKFKCAVDSKSKWKTIRDIGIGTMQCNTTNVNLNQLNELFTKVGNSSTSNDFYSCLQTVPIEHDFSFQCVNSTDVMKSITSIKSNAVGTDDVSPIFIKLLMPQLLPYITYLINSIITKSTFPQKWKQAKIIPILKANNEFRPIAILPFLSKVLENLLSSQITAFLENEKLLTEHQSGFRKKRSCTTTLIGVVEDLRKKQDKNMISMLVLLDHSKAFDTVNHDILCSKLNKLFYFSDTACNLIASYLSNRSQCVVLNEQKSNVLDISRGVPQGSILGPLLFTLYINDLPDVPETCSIQMYADDVQLYASTKVEDINSCISKFNKDLQAISEWACTNCLNINPSKSKLIIIGKTPASQPDINLRISDSTIQRVESSSNLGLTFNTKLNWTNHINRASGKIHGMLRNLWKLRTSTPQDIRLLLAKTERERETREKDNVNIYDKVAKSMRLTAIQAALHQDYSHEVFLRTETDTELPPTNSK